MSADYEWGIGRSALDRMPWFDPMPPNGHDECALCPTLVDLTAWPPLADGEPALCWMHRGERA